IEIVKLLVSNGAHIHQVMKNGWTALVTASFFGYEKIVPLLLSAGANVNQPTTVYMLNLTIK
ncbi:hypothetical protein THRCLA_21564, partial [Thraustotheca clavata]